MMKKKSKKTEPIEATIRSEIIYVDFGFVTDYNSEIETPQFLIGYEMDGKMTISLFESKTFESVLQGLPNGRLTELLGTEVEFNLGQDGLPSNMKFLYSKPLVMDN